MGGEKEAHAKTWFETDTVDAWRDQRMYKLLDPIIDADKDAKWLTVGDGRYGKDGNYIQQKGCDVLVTESYRLSGVQWIIMHIILTSANYIIHGRLFTAEMEIGINTDFHHSEQF